MVPFRDQKELTIPEKDCKFFLIPETIEKRYSCKPESIPEKVM